jgi:hypothetical protein
MHVLVQGDRYATAERALNDEIEGAQFPRLVVPLAVYEPPSPIFRIIEHLPIIVRRHQQQERGEETHSRAADRTAELTASNRTEDAD